MEFMLWYLDVGEFLLLGIIIDRVVLIGLLNIFKVCLFGFVMDVLNDVGISFNLNGYVINLNGLLLKCMGENFVLGFCIV